MANSTLSGWLDKRGGQDATKGWKRRWCIVSDNTLRYYKGDSDSVPAGTIFGEDIEDVTEEMYETQKDKHGFIFKVMTKGRDYIFSSTSSANRGEWVKMIRHMCDSHRSEKPITADVRYATAEVFLSKGIRINGDVGTVLSSQFITPTSKTTTDEKGWFIDTPQTHTTVLNLFTQHGWTLTNAFQCNATLPGTTTFVPADLFIFTHPNS